MCEKKREVIFFVYSVEPIIRPRLRLPAKQIFAVRVHTLHRTHVHYIYLPQKFKDDPMWVFSSFFHCVSLFVIKPRINLNLLLFHLSIPQLSCYGQIIILIYKLSFAVEGQSQLKGITFIPFILKCSPGILWLKP